MRTQAMRSRMTYDRPIPIGRLVGSVSDKAQITTQRYGNRPYGVGLIVAGHDVSEEPGFNAMTDDVFNFQPPHRKLVLICMNSLLQETITITMPFLLEHVLSQPRRTWKNTLNRLS